MRNIILVARYLFLCSLSLIINLNLLANSQTSTITGKVIDDDPPHNIITTDKEHGFVYPNKEHYSFVRTNVPENLVPLVRQSAQKDLRISLRREGQSLPLSKEEQRQKQFEKEERTIIRDRAREAFEKERQNNLETHKKVRDFEKPLTKKEQARIHLEFRKKEYREKRNETSRLDRTTS